MAKLRWTHQALIDIEIIANYIAMDSSRLLNIEKN